MFKFLVIAACVGGIYYYVSSHGTVQAANTLTIAAAVVGMIIFALIKS